MRYKRNITSSFITQIIRIITGFAVSILVARVLGPEGQGHIAYLMLFFGLLASYGHLGIVNAIVYFQKRSEFSEEEVFKVNLTYILIVSTVIGITMIALRYFGIIFTEYSIAIVVGGALFIFFSFINEAMRNFYIGTEDVYLSNRYILLGFFTKLVLVIVFWIAGILTVGTYVLILVLMTGISSVFLFFKFRMKFSLKWNNILLKKEFAFGIISFLIILLNYLNYRADQFMIEYFLDKSELGLYSIGVQLAELVFIIPVSLSSAFYAKIINIPIEDTKSINEITATTLKLAIYGCLALVLGGIFASYLIPFVYGQDFSGSILAAQILFASVLFASIGKIVFPYYSSQNKHRFYLISTFISFILNIIINLFLIPIFGIAGAAIASLISYAIFGLVPLCVLILKNKIPLKSILLFNKKDWQTAKDMINKILKRQGSSNNTK
jgi:O-antigen/teichoic acid export membrane protein